MATEPSSQQLLRHVGSLRLRLWLERTAQRVVRGLWLGLALLAIAWLHSWVAPVAVDRMALMAIAPIAVLLCLVWSALRPPSLQEAARTADRRLGLFEQVSTALELVRLGDHRPLAQAQVLLATEAADRARRQWPFAVEMLRRDLTLAGVFSFLAAAAFALSQLAGQLSLVFPGPAFLASTVSPPTSSAAELDAPADPIRSPGPLSAILKSLEELRQASEQKALSPEETAAMLGRLEGSLAERIAQSMATQQDLERLAKALRQVSAGREAAEAIERGDYQEAARLLAQLGQQSDALSSQARAQLGSALRRASQETTQSRELADAERNASLALGRSDYASSESALRRLGQTVSRLGESMLTPEQLSAVWERLQAEKARALLDSRDNLLQDYSTPFGEKVLGPSVDQAMQQALAGQTDRGAGGQSPLLFNRSEDAAGSGGGVGQAAGDYRPDAPGSRLDAAGVPVEVPLKLGGGPSAQGGRPGDRTQIIDQVSVLSITDAGDQPPTGFTATRPENNYVPGDKRAIIRQYFGSGGTSP